MNKPNWIKIIFGILSGLLGVYVIDKDYCLAIILLIISGYCISELDK